jgi:hypothetical protein
MKKLLFLIVLLPFLGNAQSLKNLDIKNGFLQFHFGDSLSKYKSVIWEDKVFKGCYHVPYKQIKLHKYIQSTKLYFENETLEKIEITVQNSSDEDYFNELLKKAYGNPTYQKLADDEDQPGTHLSILLWEGQRVTLKIQRMALNFNNSNNVYETITFQKASNDKIDGQLAADFPL